MITSLKGGYRWYVLTLLTLSYSTGELGHFLIGVTTRPMAQELHYGDIGCISNSSAVATNTSSCEEIHDENVCHNVTSGTAKACEWTYNGLGLEYQILAGPVFIAVFTLTGIPIGFATDKYNRVWFLFIFTLGMSIAIGLTGFVTTYWQLVVLRMLLAAGEAGCNPPSAGILSDIFDENERTMAMAIFNWSIYNGYAFAFPFGRYLRFGNLGWRSPYLVTGLFGAIVAILLIFTVHEPPRKDITRVKKENSDNPNKKKQNWKLIFKPSLVLLFLGASARYTGGYSWSYNTDMYYKFYFPGHDLQWYIFAGTCLGSIGVLAGGFMSDKLVRMGIRSRFLILAVSQFLAAPPALGSVIFNPTLAMISLGISDLFAEMCYGLLFAIMVEIVPLEVRSTTIAIYIFVTNNIGGNLPVLVDPLSKAIGYREALWVFYPGFYLLSSILFLIAMFTVDQPSTTTSTIELVGPSEAVSVT